MSEEHVEQGAVTVSTYVAYCRAAGGLLLCALVLVSFAVPVACSAFTDWWLSRWIVSVSRPHRPTVSVSSAFPLTCTQVPVTEDT